MDGGWVDRAVPARFPFGLSRWGHRDPPRSDGSGDFEREVDGSRGMGEGTDGDLVDAGRRDGGDGVEVHAAAGFQENVLLAAYFDGCTELFVRHVVEKDEVDIAEAAEEADLIEGIGFDFDENVRGAFFGFVDGALQSGGVVGNGQVVVLG